MSLALTEGTAPFVAFVGAGASAMPPSSLPTWNGFNTLLLEALSERLAWYSENRQPTDAMLSLFRERRDRTRYFAPDFQAQLIEEEIGSEYFRVWQSLESSTHGPVHTALAQLAARGRLAAIVTTNFDRLIEIALDEEGQAFRVHHDRATFEALADSPAAPLPVIKIHGSIEDAESLVDTLRQRMVGRPKPLLAALQALLRGHPWLYLGFSGADFSYDPHYLGILDAAADAKGFVFLARPGATLQDGVRGLAEAYGPERASIVSGELPEWLLTTFGLTARPPAASPSGEDAATRVKERIRGWVEGLGPMAVVNIVYSMLKSAGLEKEALWLMRKTWRSYRTGPDTEGPSYHRYNYNYGLSLLETGFIRNPIKLAEDKSNLLEWREHADQNAYEFLARSYVAGKLLTAGIHLAAVLAYRGEVGKAVALASEVTDAAIERDARLELCDIAIASGVIYDVVQIFSGPILQFRRCVQLAKELGDEPRRAMLCVNLGRFLTYRREFEEADAFLLEAERIGTRLDLQSVLLATKAARGLWLADSGASAAEAVQVLGAVVETLDAMDAEPIVTKVDLARPDDPPVVIRGRHPVLCRVLLDLTSAAFLAQDTDVVNRTLDRLDELVTDVFLGYCPHYYLQYARGLLTYGEPGQQELARDLIRRARELGETSRNPWVTQAADHLAEATSGAGT